MSIQRGVAVSWSIDTTTTGTGIGTHLPQSYDYSREGDEKRLRGTDGVLANHTFFDNLEKLQLEVIPSSTLVSNNAAQNILPTRGNDVTVASAKDNQITGSGTGAGTCVWRFVSGSKKATVDGETRLTFNLERSETYLATTA